MSHHTRPPQPHWDLAFWTSNCHLHHSGLRGLRTPIPWALLPCFPSVTSILLGLPKENLSLRGFLGPRPSDSKSLDADCCLPDPPAVDCQILGGRGGFSLKSDPHPAGAWHRGGAQGGHRQGRLCHRKRVSGKNGKSEKPHSQVETTMGTGREDKVGGRRPPLFSPAFAGGAQGAWQMRRVWVDLLHTLFPPAFLVPKANHLASTPCSPEATGDDWDFGSPSSTWEAAWTPSFLGLPWTFWPFQSLSGVFPPHSCLGGRRITILCLSSPAPVATRAWPWRLCCLGPANHLWPPPPLCHFPSVRGCSRSRGRSAKSLGRGGGGTALMGQFCKMKNSGNGGQWWSLNSLNALKAA